MKQSLFHEKYPIYTLELNKEESSYRTVDAIADYFKVQIDQHAAAAFIAVFDHYAHTKGLADGEIAPAIRAAKNVVFCFGIKLLTPEVLAVRPRSIGIAELDDRFVVTFMETPMPFANDTMEQWAKGLLNTAAQAQ